MFRAGLLSHSHFPISIFFHFWEVDSEKFQTITVFSLSNKINSEKFTTSTVFPRRQKIVTNNGIISNAHPNHAYTCVRENATEWHPEIFRKTEKSLQNATVFQCKKVINKTKS